MLRKTCDVSLEEDFGVVRDPQTNPTEMISSMRTIRGLKVLAWSALLLYGIIFPLLMGCILAFPDWARRTVLRCRSYSDIEQIAMVANAVFSYLFFALMRMVRKVPYRVLFVLVTLLMFLLIVPTSLSMRCSWNLHQEPLISAPFLLWHYHVMCIYISLSCFCLQSVLWWPTSSAAVSRSDQNDGHDDSDDALDDAFIEDSGDETNPASFVDSHIVMRICDANVWPASAAA